MGGIVLYIDVLDNGTVKVKQFADETKKAFDEMKKGPEQLTKSFDTNRESWIGWAAGAGIATAAGYAAKKMIFDMAPALASAGSEIGRMARNFNMATDDFQKWSYVANMADISIQEFGGAFAFLTRSMNEALQGSGDASKAFNALGIALKDSTGKTKDQQTVLMETIGTLEKYGDGVNRDALMLGIFGRAFMSIKPLIDQGTKAIQENKEEAEKLGLILGKDVVKSLSAADETFKQFGMTLKVARMEFFDPLVKSVADLTKELLGLKRAWGEGGLRGIWKELQEQSERYKIEELGSAAWTKEWVAGWTPPKITKAEAPALGTSSGGKAAKEEDLLSAYNSLIQKGSEWGEVVMARQELTELGWVKEKDIVEQVREELARLERETNVWGEITVAKQELVEAGWEKAKKQTNQLEEVWTTLSKNISSAWNFNVTGILRGTENIGDAFKNMADGMVDAFVSGITEMIAQWALFGSITGKKKSDGGFLYGGSWSGILGSVAGLFTSAQEGGVFTRPTPILIGDAGDEAAVPLKGGKIPIEGKTGGDTYIINNYNQVNDPNTFERLYGPVVKKLSAQSVAEAKRLHRK